MERYSINIPTTLTLVRLILSPLVLPVALVYLMPYNNQIINALLALFFLLLSLTDFFDGYLARKYKQETTIGKALDPLADKFLFLSALIAFVTLKKIFFYWSILFIGREFFIMGLRILALEQGFDVPVSWFGKLKTVMQTLYITIAISNCHSKGLMYNYLWSDYLEYSMLAIALFFSLASAYLYYKSFMKQFQIFH